MANEHAGIEQLWRDQPNGRPPMALDEIRARAREFERRVQQWRRVGGLTVALLIAKTGWEVWRDSDMVERAGDLLILAALVYLVVRFVRHARADTRPATLGQTSCLEHYRRQLVRQRDLSLDGWKYVLPFVPGLGLMVGARALQGRPASQVMVLIVFAIVLFAGVLWVMARGTRVIEREIAAIARE
jgi:HAMP domain-containing protein